MSGSAAGGTDLGYGGTVAGGSPGQTPDLRGDGTSPGTLPGLGGGGSGAKADGAGRNGSTADADAAPASLRAETVRRQTAALLLLGLGILVLVASAAWWSGAFRRLHARLFATPAGDELAEEVWPQATPGVGSADAGGAVRAVPSAVGDRDGP
jgi:hypothetical protein